MSDLNVNSTRLDFCWYRVEYTAPVVDSEETIYIVYVFDIPEAGEDSIKNAVYRQIYRFSDSLLEKDFPIEIKAFTCIDKMCKVD